MLLARTDQDRDRLALPIATEVNLGAEAATTASQGLLTVQPNEADLYGYVAEHRDLVDALATGRAPLLDWDYGAQIVRLTMAAYMSAETGRTVDLTDPATSEALEGYVPLIQQGRGREVLHVSG